MGKDSERNLFPLFRSLFAVFFVHELFSYIQKTESEDSPYPWQPANTAWLFIGVGALGVALTFLSEALELNSLVSMLIFIVLLFVQYYVLYKVQLVINRAGGDPFGHSNTKLTMENHLWGAFGLYIWISSFYTCYLEMTGQLVIPPMFEVQADKDTSVHPTEDEP